MNVCWNLYSKVENKKKNKKELWEKEEITF